MKIVASFVPSEEIQKDFKDEFPNIEIEYYKGIKNAEKAFTDAEVFLTYGEDLTPEYIELAKNLKWIMVLSAGLERMPFAACADKGILVTNASGIHKIPMAEFTLGTMLEHVKQRKQLRENEISKKWDRKVPMAELSGKTIMVLGIGAIGGEIARLAQAFGMKVIGFNRSGHANEFADITVKLDKLEEHLSEPDFIVSVLPSTSETKYLLNEDHFRLMKKSAVFINIGRGDLVKEEVLLKALEEELISHAYLDVFENEPLKPEHPFWEMNNVTVTPHLSSITKKYQPRGFEIFKHNLHTYINNGNDFINVIDLERGY
ncbi:D-2-hydroxyacid dehydrogenase [Neobacillus terrae]|uniref:D-2-hydroxyacid dehydrogenase n=1 Tax=Neobacillus terrae TaxID=3034837 RepID=UPI00140E000F|nr:D-2-hydroxyacid dehydrogenase [Neobacillus terrae]NHM33293.1 D-2-hydroxyacid dehydrogenase [Neobacillus terrae]